MTLNPEQKSALLSVRDGADIYCLTLASTLRKIHNTKPELIDIVPPMDDENEHGVRAYFGCKTTAAGIEAAEEEIVPRYETCESIGHCPKPTEDAAPFHHFYWDSDRDTQRMEQIHGPNGKGHDDPLSEYGAVVCKTCEFQALVLNDADDFPEI